MSDPNEPGPSGQHGGGDEAQSRGGEIRRIVNRFAQRERERARRAEQAQQTQQAQQAQQAQRAQSPTPNTNQTAPLQGGMSPTKRLPDRPYADDDPFGPDKGKGPELPPPAEQPAQTSPERRLKARVLGYLAKRTGRTTMGAGGSGSPHKQEQPENPISKWVSESSKSLIPPGSDLARQAGPHYQVNTIAELGTVLASADRVISLCGSPVVDMQYTVVVVPAADLSLLIRGYGNAEEDASAAAVLELLQAGQALRGAHEQASGQVSERAEEQEGYHTDSSHSIATTTFRGSRSGITRWQGPPTPTRATGQAAEEQTGESSQPKNPARSGSRPDPAGSTPSLTVRSPGKGKGKEKEVAPVTRRLLSPDARKLVEAVLLCDQEKQKEERTKAEKWKSPRSRQRRLSDADDIRDHHQIDTAFRNYQRNVFLQVAEIMELLSTGKKEENPGINGKI